LAVTTLKEPVPKLLKKQKLRNYEYYDTQNEFDELYRKSKEGKSCNNLLPIIASENNILLAYRNIKNNDGSSTAGTDGITIEHYKEWSEEKFINYFQDKLANYIPKSVRRVEIPKDGGIKGKVRPLGIPCMDDRIIQQCILQVLEPICEAKFYNHSYGFRPNRATSHAMARVDFLLYQGFHYVVDIDIKSFFDEVNHGKLLKQMWALGIQDKNLLCIIGKILKSEIQGLGMPDKGTPQGGLISPLLSNIVLNELDWWLSGQWETIPAKYPYKRKWKYHALRKSSTLKEFFPVRYADDFKIFCKDYETAQKIFAATKQWLKERLGLEASPEKSRITNARKGKTEFLGFALFVKEKGKKLVVRSNTAEKAKTTMKSKLKKQIIAIQKNTTPQQVNRLNSMILGMHNYYKIATLCNLDFSEINYVVRRSLYNRLRKKSKIRKIRNKGKLKHEKYTLSKSESPKSKTYLKFYGNYKGKTITIAGITIFPIYGCTFQIPLGFKQDTCNYTEAGRRLVHSKLNNTPELINYLLSQKEYEKSVEYNDNRISLIAGQNGKCFVTGEHLTIGDMDCHHKQPKEVGGTDDYGNLVWIKSDVHKLIHATTLVTIEKCMQILRLDKKALQRVNSLRKLAGNSEIIALNAAAA
jgi:group II intron reverse transcriptase/maturase